MPQTVPKRRLPRMPTWTDWNMGRIKLHRHERHIQRCDVVQRRHLEVGRVKSQCTAYFNGDISKWDVSSVTGMSGMFQGAVSFNGDISKWDVSSVTDMSAMFSNAQSFNGDISKWDVSSVTSMHSTFRQTKLFNGDISKWDVSRVTDMDYMFYGASSFAWTLCGA